MRIVLSPRADQQLLDQIRSLAERNPDAAERHYTRITEAIDKLADMPSWGRPGRIPGTRELAIPGTAYVLIYQMYAETIEILRLYHGRQNWQQDIQDLRQADAGEEGDNE